MKDSERDTQEHLFNLNSSYNPVPRIGLVGFIVISLIIIAALYFGG